MNFWLEITVYRQPFVRNFQYLFFIRRVFNVLDHSVSQKRGIEKCFSEFRNSSQGEGLWPSTWMRKTLI